MVASQKSFPVTGQPVKDVGAVKRAPSALFAFVIASVLAKSTATPEEIFVSPCECIGFHGKNRWVTKTERVTAVALGTPCFRTTQ